MTDELAKVLITADQIAVRVREIAKQIVADHTPPKVSGESEILIVPVLTGAMIFCCDLIRQMPIAMKIGLLTVSSYPGASIRTQGSTVVSQQLGDVTGRHVLLLDDILDSGGTMRAVVPLIESLGAASVKTCVLLRKDRPESRDMHIDYVGFAVPDEFVVGYGLDYNDYYRNVPDIAVLTPAAIEARS